MDRPLDVHQTITLSPPPPSSDLTDGPDGPGRITSPGVPGQSSAQVHAALVASTRTDASLSGLMRAIQELARGVGGAREANEQLVRELEALRDLLGSSNEQQLSLRNRLATVLRERELEKRDAAADKAFLSEQYDAFLSDLLDDHEQAVAELRRERDAAQARIAELEARMLTQGSLAPATPRSSPRHPIPQPETGPKPQEELVRLELAVEKLTQERERTREALQRLQGQRDEAQSQAAKAIRERDEAQAEADRLRGEVTRAQRSSNRPPSTRPQGARPPSGRMPAVRALSKPLSSRRTDPPPGRQPALELESLEAELTPNPSPATPSSPASAPPTSSSPKSSPQAAKENLKPPLKQKPDPSSRPLIGYSLKDSVAPESLGSRSSSKPPKV